MIRVKDTSPWTYIPTADWVRQLAVHTSAFEIVKVVEREPERSNPRNLEWDQVISIQVKPDQRQVDLFVQARQQISPNTVLGFFHKLHLHPPDGVPLLCAPYIPPRVAEMCQAENVSYLDGVGNCRIVAPGLFIHIAGRPNRPPVSKTVDPFCKKSSRIIRALLASPNQGWQVQQLAKQADVSLGLASKVKTTLLEEAYLEERDRLLFVRDPVQLLHGWSGEYRPHVKRIQLFAIPRPKEIEKRVAQWCQAVRIAYALTQLSAAWRYSPMVRYDKSVIYIDKKLETGDKLKALLSHLDAKEVESGANCTLWITDDPAVFTDTREFDGLKVVSPLQLYLDLKVLSGRGEDAAEEIFAKELKPSLGGGGRLRNRPEANHERD